MNTKQFEEIMQLSTVFGQFVSILSVTDQEKNLLPEYKNKGIKKVTKFQAHVRKQSYIEVLNTSTGAVELGLEFKPKRESFYNDIGHNGFCRSLKKDPSKLYLEIRFNDKDVSPEFSILVDDAGKVYPNTILKEKTKTARQELIDKFEISIRQFKVESIARIRIAGLDLIDPALDKYNHIQELIFDKALG